MNNTDIPPLAEETTLNNGEEFTSPNQLYEVTSSANATIFDQTKLSPMRGRSVKEYDELLQALKKENFNLKLRIYFLEERMGSTFRLEDKENVIRKNIEYQVEIETLRKELDEKQDLLCQAVKALELEDTEHKRILSLKDSQIQDLKKSVESAEEELKNIQNVNDELKNKVVTLEEESEQICNEVYGLQLNSDNSKEEIENMRMQLAELQNELTEVKEQNALLEQENRDLECLEVRCKNLEVEITEKEANIEQLVGEIESTGNMVSSCNLRIRTLEDALVSSNSDLEFKDKELKNKEKNLQQQANELEELRKKVEETNRICNKEQRQVEILKAAIVARDNKIADLETKSEKNKSTIRNLESKCDTFVHELKRNRDEIHTLKQRRSNSGDCDFKLSPRKQNSNDSKISSLKSASSSTISNPNTDSDIVEEPQNCIQEVHNKDIVLTKTAEDYKKACTLIKNLLEHKSDLEMKSSLLEESLKQKERELEEYKKMNGFKFDSSSNHTRLENSVELEEMDENKKIDDSSLYDTTSLEWEKQVEDLIEVLQEKEAQLLKYQTILQEKDNRIVDLESEITSLKSELEDAQKKLENFQIEKSDTTAEKDKIIEQLETEVRKQNCNLQGIVNKELWDKNREIEKLQNRFTEKIKNKESEISELEKQITSKDMQLKMLKDKISELGIQINLPCSLLLNKIEIPENIEETTPEQVIIIKEQLKVSSDECKYLHKTVEELRQQLRNTPERDNSDHKILQLKEDIVRLQKDLEKSDKIRQETVSICATLTNRLEELALFLDSLLKHKSVLGVLGVKQRSAIKQAIDQSLDLSKSFSMSLMHEDTSLAQLSSISGLLNSSQISNIIEDESCLSFKKNLSFQRGDTFNEQSEIIAILRTQIETMKKEIEIRDMELAKQNYQNVELLKNDNDLIEAIIDLQPSNKSINKVETPTKILQKLVSNSKSQSFDQNCSESEAWSEPDRCVSKARIGLDSEVLNKSISSKSNKSINGGSSESTDNEFISISKKRGSIESIVSFENKLKEKENEILTLKSEILNLNNKSLELKLNLSEEVAKLRNEKIDLENQIFKLENEQEDKLKQIEQFWKSQLESDFIPKAEMFKQVTDMERMLNEVESIKELLKGSDERISKMESNEQDLKRKMTEMEDIHREKVISLKRELNESTLRASQAALERTKVSNEKLKLEAEIRKLEMREAAKMNELEEKERDFTNMKNNLQIQLAHAEQEKSCLHLKVSELESLNAELKNKLVKITSEKYHHTPKISEILTNFKLFRQRSDISGYNSEDNIILTDDNEPSNSVFNKSAPDRLLWFNHNANLCSADNVDARVVTNSSPDLGIESDQGRFSSLETNVTSTARPLLQTLELTASMNNLLSTHQLDNVGHYCNIIAHKNLETENTDLKINLNKLENRLEKTMSELSKINKTKLQVEKAVCKQIHKTSKVLRQARANLDSGSENEKRT